jgi:hypothetical protein
MIRMPSRSTFASRAASPNRPDTGVWDQQLHLAELARLAALLDSRYRIPGTQWRFGIDAILGLVPGIGDTLAALPALYLIWRAQQLGVPKRLLLRMIANVAIDTAFGSVPIAGNIFDLFFKASRRNVALLRRHIERSGAERG